jgi:hypothetical protein
MILAILEVDCRAFHITLKICFSLPNNLFLVLLIERLFYLKMNKNHWEKGLIKNFLVYMGSRAINCFILGKIGQDKKTLR